ncbi:MAG: SCP2 sterol-binding domain-containing protein [Streptomyces sp.]|nr:SCP2 sterol-binding domain-containing protein [Streptomyces sp.]
MAVDSAHFEELKEVVSSRSGQSLLDWANEQEGGVDGVLDQVFTAMPEVFNAKKAAGKTADFQYRIQTPDGLREYFVRVMDGTCEGGRGTVENPQVTITVKVPEFLRMVSGKLNGMQAFLTGKVKLNGDMFLATKFETWFDRP